MVTIEENTWEVLKRAHPVLQGVRKMMTPEAYEDDKLALKKFLVGYFNGDNTKDCDQKQGNAISPIGGRTNKGGKRLKVRWAIPGGGKRGGLRLAMAVYCDEKRVRIAGAWIRKDDPQDADFDGAFQDAP